LRCLLTTFGENQRAFIKAQTLFESLFGDFQESVKWLKFHIEFQPFDTWVDLNFDYIFEGCQKLLLDYKFCIWLENGEKIVNLETSTTVNVG
jgi:hypothetical protein